MKTGHISESINEYEELCEMGRAWSKEACSLRKIIRNHFKYYGYEYCSHNLAIYGSKRYSCCLNKNLSRLVTIAEWNMLSDDEIKNFNYLQEFPWERQKKS